MLGIGSLGVLLLPLDFARLIERPSPPSDTPVTACAAPMAASINSVDLSAIRLLRRPDFQAGAASSAGLDPVAPVHEIWRSDDGLFYVDGSVNGRPVRFLIDTGASMIVLTAEDAQRAGLTTDRSAAVLDAETAGGRSMMAKVTLDSMAIGATRASAVPAAIATSGLRVSLLGQNWLSHLASVTIEGDRMLLR